MRKNQSQTMLSSVELLQEHLKQGRISDQQFKLLLGLLLKKEVNKQVRVSIDHFFRNELLDLLSVSYKRRQVTSYARS
jgi:hypothetical protein